MLQERACAPIASDEHAQTTASPKTEPEPDSFVGKDVQPGVPRIGRDKSACGVFSSVTRRAKTLADRCYVGG